MQIPETSLGTVIAALVAAAISLVGLLISKDQKTTEFRQAWIDRLREDVAEFLSYHSLMTYQIRLKNPGLENDIDYQNETLVDLKDEIVKLERVYAAILLRLNPKEHGHIVAKIDEIKSLYSSKDILDPVLMNKHEIELLGLFQKELKKEWKRVKSGEIAFRLARYLSIIFVILGIYILAINM